MHFNEPVASGANPTPQPPALFDVCHVGVVLRVVLSVQCVMALALAFAAPDAADAFNRWSQTTVATLPASLLWLVLACAARRPLQRARESVQWLFATGLGAGVAVLAQWELAWLAQVPAGDAALLMVLAASASYIAVPAVVRYAIPEADPSLYVSLSLGVTFPLNILVGIPLYTQVVLRLWGG